VKQMDFTVLALNSTALETLTSDLLSLMVAIIPVLIIFGIFGRFKGWF